MLGKDGTLRIVGIPIWAALAAFFLLKAALAWAIASYAGKKGYQRWVFFALAFLLDPLAVFVIMLMDSRPLHLRSRVQRDRHGFRAFKACGSGPLQRALRMGRERLRPVLLFSRRRWPEGRRG